MEDKQIEETPVWDMIIDIIHEARQGNNKEIFSKDEDA